MKIGLLLPGNIYFCPFVNIYTKILKESKIDFDILFWDRENKDEKDGIAYSRPFPYNSAGKIKWLFEYMLYVRFLVRKIKKNKYDKLIVFGPQVGLFLYFFLRKRYYKRFCFDYRDIYIEQKFPRLFRKFLQNSALNVISSPGFIKYLPSGFDYIMSHNFDIETLDSTNIKIKHSIDKPAVITTIGSIRDYEQNHQVMMALSNHPDFIVKFIGRPGNAGKLLQEDSIKHKINNVEFLGFYDKKDEATLIADADFLNIYYPNINTHATALSNRFYIALISKKPMIVTKYSIQGDYIEKYNLGLAITNCSNLAEDILCFIEKYDHSDFKKNCDNLMHIFLEDYNYFKERLISFLSEN